MSAHGNGVPCPGGGDTCPDRATGACARRITAPITAAVAGDAGDVRVGRTGDTSRGGAGTALLEAVERWGIVFAKPLTR